MKQRIDLSQSREFGEILSDTFLTLHQNLKPLLKAYFSICGAFLITDILISIFVNINSVGTSSTSFPNLMELFFDFINYTMLILTVLCYFSLYKDKGNQPPYVIEVWGYFKYYFFRVFVTELLIAVAGILGALICFLPGVYLFTVFALVTPVMVIENGSISYSFKKAFKLINGNWWFTFGILLLATIIILMLMLVLMLPPMIIYGGGQWLAGKQLSTAAAVMQAIIINLCQILWIIPFTAGVLIYTSLTEQKEAGSLLSRIQMFGQKLSQEKTLPEQY